MRTNAALRFFATLLACVPLALAAQAPRPYLSGETRGHVVDASTGQPVEGAIVVARWDWLAFHPTFHGSAYSFNGDAVHVAEAVTGRGGDFVIPRWGPTLRAGGKMDEKAPNLTIFKPGYMPYQGAAAGGGPIGLEKFAGAPKQYAESIARIQGAMPGAGAPGVGLAWQHPGENWKAMPRMVDALHREKARLGEDGAAIRGAHLLHGRAGRGQLVDASGQPVTPAIVWIAWTMRKVDGTVGTRRLVQAKRAGVEGSSAHFFVSPWRLPAPELPGWEIATDATPLVRIYAPGYRRSAEVRWEEKGATVALQKLPAEREAALAELRTWRRDLDAEVAKGEDEAVLVAQRPFLEQFAEQCRALTPDLRAGVCYEEGSPVARYMVRARANTSYAIETEEGVRTIRVVAARGESLQAQAPAAPAGAPAPRARVNGFTIEPAR